MIGAVETLKNKLVEAEAWDKKLLLKRGDFLKHAETNDSNVYFIEEGCVRLFFSEDKHDHVINFGFQGSLVSALESYILEKSSSIAIQAINKTRVSVISKANLKRFVEQDEQMTKLWPLVFEEITLARIEREKDLLIRSSELRYQRVIGRAPKLFQEIPHKYIASYLRMTPETLSRLQNS